MEYQLLTDDQKHDILVQYHEAQERDHYCHSINKARYEAILADTTVSQEFRKRVEKLLSETNARLHEVEHILEKTRPQLPSAKLVQAAKARVLTSPQK